MDDGKFNIFVQEVNSIREATHRENARLIDFLGFEPGKGVISCLITVVIEDGLEYVDEF
jgi:hypothetical protein